MFQVGHYIGLGCHIILCLQQIPQGAVVEGETVGTLSCFSLPLLPLSLLQPTVNHSLVSCSQMTDYAVKDYNRARAYLSDLANRDKVPVFDDITEAVDEAVKFLRRDR